jgi:hypothetical protein
MFVWVMLVWAATQMLPHLTLTRRRVAALASAAGVLAVAAAATAVAVALRPDYHLPEYRPLGAVYAALDRTIPRRRTVLLIGSLDSRTFRFKMAARFALVKRGIRPLSPGKDVRLGSWYEQDHHRYDCVVYVKDGATSPARRTTVIARVTFDDGTGSYPISVWTSAAGCPQHRVSAPRASSARCRKAPSAASCA